MSPKRWLGAARCFLCSFNLLVFALGSLLLVFSLWMLLDRHSFAAALGSPLLGLRLGAYVCCGLGAACALLGGLGGLGALRGLRVLLGLYFGLLLLLLMAQITIGVIAYTQRVALAARVAAHARDLLSTYPAWGAPGAAHESWDALQQQLGCCGWSGPRDWDTPGAPPGTVACSCLAPPAPNGTQGTPPGPPHGRCPTAGPGGVFTRGCAEGAGRWLAENLVGIVGGGLGLGLLELCLLLLAMFLLRDLGPASGC